MQIMANRLRRGARPRLQRRRGPAPRRRGWLERRSDYRESHRHGGELVDQLGVATEPVLVRRARQAERRAGDVSQLPRDPGSRTTPAKISRMPVAPRRWKRMAGRWTHRTRNPLSALIDRYLAAIAESWSGCAPSAINPLHVRAAERDRCSSTTPSSCSPANACRISAAAKS